MNQNSVRISNHCKCEDAEEDELIKFLNKIIKHYELKISRIQENLIKNKLKTTPKQELQLYKKLSFQSST